jgi:uncharacterized protein (DUF4415 family)
MKKLSGKQRQMLERLANLPDSAIDFSDIPERVDWSNAERGKFYRPVKQSVTMRVDADVLAWFKSNSDKYQSRINEVLREFVQTQRKSRATKQ